MAGAGEPSGGAADRGPTGVGGGGRKREWPSRTPPRKAEGSLALPSKGGTASGRVRKAAGSKRGTRASCAHSLDPLCVGSLHLTFALGARTASGPLRLGATRRRGHSRFPPPSLPLSAQPTPPRSVLLISNLGLATVRTSYCRSGLQSWASGLVGGSFICALR